MFFKSANPSLSWLLLLSLSLLLLLAIPSAGGELRRGSEFQERETFQDTILLAFDSSCLSQHGETAPREIHRRSKLMRKPDSSSFRVAKSAETETAKSSSSPSQIERAIALLFPEDSDGRRLEDEDDDGHHDRNYDHGSGDRRRREIMASFHLAVSSKLVGDSKASQLLEFEEDGDISSAVALVFGEHPELKDKLEANDIVEKLKRRRRQQQRGGGEGRRMMIESEEGIHEGLHDKQRKGIPMITSLQHLKTLDFTIVENVFLIQGILDIATDLPCLRTPPELDHAKEDLSLLPDGPENGDEHHRSIFLTNLSDLTAASPSGTPTHDDPTASPSDDPTASPSPAKNSMYTFFAPNDAHFPEQWYLFGPGQNEVFGANVVNGWSSIIVSLEKKSPGNENVRRELHFQNLLTRSGGISVAVLDSGCAPNPDLTHNLERKIEPDCQSVECLSKKLAKEDKIHGSSTGGIIAAESDNGIGIAGICPTCKIMCLKIYDSEKQRITLSAVIRALETVAKGRVKLSNHSYGGFGESAIELEAHRLLQNQGHLSICAAGNNGCNIDSGASIENGACRQPNGRPMGPFTPAAYNLDSILAVGATTRTGQLAWFSNYGPRTVHMFAPGDEILTLYGTDKLATVKGTSFSAPVLAGVAAMVWAHRPSLTVAELKNILMESGTQNPDLLGKGRSPSIANLQGSIDLVKPDYVYTHVQLREASAESELMRPSSSTLAFILFALVISIIIGLQ